MCLASDGVILNIILLTSALNKIIYAQNDQIWRPPSINTTWKSVEYFQVGSSQILTCFAEGSPTLKYTFDRNGTTLDENEVGFYEINPMSQGVYQCKVRNNYGTSITEKSEWIMATSTGFQLKPEEIKLENPSYFTSFRCSPMNQSIPDPIIKWYRNTNIDVVNSKHVQFDGKDTLYFANVETEKLNSFWCTAHNEFLRMTANSSHFLMAFTDSDGFTQFGSTLLTASDNNSNAVIGLQGNIITLRCLFAGYPTPDVTWYRGDSPISIDDWEYLYESTHIRTRRPLDNSYGGWYRCEGRNINGAGSHNMTLLVQSVPAFLSDGDGPQNTIATAGDTATFSCKPSAEPPATIGWFKNGESLIDGFLPEKYFIEDNGEKLKIINVCKTCPNETGDIAVIRCEAFNNNGKVSSEGYLSVLERTVLDKSVYADVMWTANKNMTFPCIANGDLTLPINCMWYWQGKQIVNGTDQRLVVTDNGTLHVIMDGDEAGGKNKIGLYKVAASNGYSTDEKEFSIYEAPASLWWISLIVIAILLLLLLLLLLLWCCCCKNKRARNDYPVDKKERLRGNDPVKELDNLGFHDFQAGSNLAYTESSGNGVNVAGVNSNNALYGNSAQEYHGSNNDVVDNTQAVRSNQNLSSSSYYNNTNNNNTTTNNNNIVGMAALDSGAMFNRNSSRSQQSYRGSHPTMEYDAEDGNVNMRRRGSSSYRSSFQNRASAPYGYNNYYYYDDNDDDDGYNNVETLQLQRSVSTDAQAASNSNQVRQHHHQHHVLHEYGAEDVGQQTTGHHATSGHHVTTSHQYRQSSSQGGYNTVHHDTQDPYSEV